jgi:hypothetical protein
MCERYKQRAERWEEIATSAREISAQRAKEVNEMKDTIDRLRAEPKKVDQFGRDITKFVYHKTGNYKGRFMFCQKPWKDIVPGYEFIAFHWHQVTCPKCLEEAPKTIKKCYTCNPERIK